MTVIPSMTRKTSITGVLLACVGASALIAIVQTIELSGSGGWRSNSAAPTPMMAPSQTRGSNGVDASSVADAGDVSTARGRN